MHIGLLTFDLFLPGSQSLKSKRSLIKSLKDRVRSQFNVSIAEVGSHDKWQKSIISVCAIGTDRRLLDSTLQSIVSLVEKLRDIEISNTELEFL